MNLLIRCGISEENISRKVLTFQTVARPISHEIHGIANHTVRQGKCYQLKSSHLVLR